MIVIAVSKPSAKKLVLSRSAGACGMEWTPYRHIQCAGTYIREIETLEDMQEQIANPKSDIARALKNPPLESGDTLAIYHLEGNRSGGYSFVHIEDIPLSPSCGD